ncbi:hypothetical protein D3C78_1855440 [compost metagenome]
MNVQRILLVTPSVHVSLTMTMMIWMRTSMRRKILLLPMTMKISIISTMMTPKMNCSRMMTMKM